MICRSELILCFWSWSYFVIYSQDWNPNSPSRFLIHSEVLINYSSAAPQWYKLQTFSRQCSLFFGPFGQIWSCSKDIFMFYINTLSQKSDSEIGLQYIRMRIKTQLPKHCPTSAVYIEHEHEYELGYLYRNSECAVLVNVHPVELIIIILSWWSPYILYGQYDSRPG